MKTVEVNTKRTSVGTYSTIAFISIGCHVLSFLFSIITKRYVMPYEYGIFTTANMLLLYMNYLQLGVLNAYSRDYPQLLGAGNNKEAQHMKYSVFSFLFILYFVVVVVIGLSLTIMWHSGMINTLLYGGFMFNSVLALITVVSNYWDNTNKSEQHYLKPSFALVVKTILLVSIGFVLVRKYYYWGLLVATLLSLLFSLVVYWKDFIGLRLVWDLALIKKLIKTGLLLLINSLVWTFMMSIDKFVILGFFDYESLGIYSAALIGFSTLVMIPQSLSSVFYVKLSHQFGADNDLKELAKSINQYTCVLSLIISVVSVVAYYLLPPFIMLAMPAYSEGVPSAQLLVMGVAVYSSSMLFGHFFTITRKNVKLLRNTIALCIMNIVFSIGFVLLLGHKIDNVAIGTTLSYALYGLMLCLAIKGETGSSFWNNAVNSVFPVCVAIAMIQITDALAVFWVWKILIAICAFAIFSIIFYRKTIISFFRKKM
jgi:O-antigen/teichoic acid export membrane protein